MTLIPYRPHGVPKPIGLTSVCESLIIHLRLELAAGVRICSTSHKEAFVERLRFPSTVHLSLGLRYRK